MKFALTTVLVSLSACTLAKPFNVTLSASALDRQPTDSDSSSDINGLYSLLHNFLIGASSSIDNFTETATDSSSTESESVSESTIAFPSN